MFTGIVEGLAQIERIEKQGTNVHFEFSGPFTESLKIDQSVSHNGVCLTVVDINVNLYKVTAVEETLLKTNLAFWKMGDKVNVERCLQANGRYDGHIVQGHVDGLGKVKSIDEREGSWLIEFSIDRSFAHLVVEKGSICINGVSLTCFDVSESSFKVTIIPYTWMHTNFQFMSVGDTVNLEFDIIGKYVARMLHLRGIID
jgi:riboflavin synthase